MLPKCSRSVAGKTPVDWSGTKAAKGDPRRLDACMWVPRGVLDRPRVERSPGPSKFETSRERERER